MVAFLDTEALVVAAVGGGVQGGLLLRNARGKTFNKMTHDLASNARLIFTLTATPTPNSNSRYETPKRNIM